MKPDPEIARRRYHANPTEENRKLLSASDQILLKLAQKAEAADSEMPEWDWDKIPTQEEMEAILKAKDDMSGTER